ncbi:MAG: SDR family oxidoreductase [bacterium]
MTNRAREEIMTVLVLGATGNVGSKVVAELRALGAPVRAFARDREKAVSTLGPDAEVAVGNFDDPATVRRALGGVDAVLITASDGPQKVEHETNLIDIVAAEGARRVVKLSTVGAGTAPGPQFDAHGRIEDHLARSGLPSVVLRSSFYMTNLLGSAEAIKATGKLFAPAGGVKVSMIDPRDVAGVAARVLTTDAHEGKTYVLTGPELLTFDDVAAHLSAATGRTVEFVDVPADIAREQLLGTGMPDWMADLILAAFKALREGIAADTSDAVRALTGLEPRSFAAFARDHAALFGGEGPSTP